MKKRSKLDLNPDVEQGKSQAAGFHTEPPADPAPEPESEPKTEPSPKSAPEPQYNKARVSSGEYQSRESVAVLPKPSSRVLIIKTVAVVAVAALSLYILRRRLL